MKEEKKNTTEDMKTVSFSLICMKKVVGEDGVNSLKKERLE